VERPSYVMQRYHAKGPGVGARGPVKHRQEFIRPYPYMRLFYVEHHNGFFDVYWVDAELLIPEGPIPIPREDMQSL